MNFLYICLSEIDPDCPPHPGLPPANVAQRPKRCQTKFPRANAALLCTKTSSRLQATERWRSVASSSGEAVPAAPACPPFSSCRLPKWRAEKRTQPEMFPTRLQCCPTRNTSLSLSIRNVCFSLSLLGGGGGGGGGSQANTFTPTARGEVTLLQKRERGRPRSTE